MYGIVFHSKSLCLGNKGRKLVGGKHSRLKLVAEKGGVAVGDRVENHYRHGDAGLAKRYAFFYDCYCKICGAKTL